MASANAPSPVWGVVDLYGMAVKVTIVDSNTAEPELPIPSLMAPLQAAEHSLVNTLRQFLDSCDGSERVDSRVITGLFFPLVIVEWSQNDILKQLSASILPSPTVIHILFLYENITDFIFYSISEIQI